MTVSLPQRKVNDLVERLETWPPGRQAATVREILVVPGKRNQATFVIRPGRYFIARLLQLSGLHLKGEELAGRGDEWGRTSEKAEAEHATGLTPEVMVDVAWWVVCFLAGRSKKGERISAPFCRIVKQKPARQLFSDISFRAVEELCMETTDKRRSRRRGRARVGR